jgi:hypothetical protein
MSVRVKNWPVVMNKPWNKKHSKRKREKQAKRNSPANTLMKLTN